MTRAARGGYWWGPSDGGRLVAAVVALPLPTRARTRTAAATRPRTHARNPVPMAGGWRGARLECSVPPSAPSRADRDPRSKTGRPIADVRSDRQAAALRPCCGGGGGERALSTARYSSLRARRRRRDSSACARADRERKNTCLRRVNFFPNSFFQSVRFDSVS